MNIEKLYPECKALGRAYRILTDVVDGPIAAKGIQNAPNQPLPQTTQKLAQCFKYRKMTPEIHRAITELFCMIDLDDNDVLQGPMPLELQGAFMEGYWLGMIGLSDKSRLATMRKKKNFTQVELAELIKVTQKDISNWESLKYSPSANSLRALAKALDCSIEDILEDE